MAPTTFRANTPSLAFYADGKLVKFAGGRLVAQEDQVEAVEAFAEANPHYGIEAVDESAEAEETSQEPAKRETVDEVIERVGDDPAAAQEALDAELASDDTRTTLVAALEAVIEDAGSTTVDETQAVLDQALEQGILAEPMEASDSVSARIKGDTLILTFADESVTRIRDGEAVEDDGDTA